MKEGVLYNFASTELPFKTVSGDVTCFRAWKAVLCLLNATPLRSRNQKVWPHPGSLLAPISTRFPFSALRQYGEAFHSHSAVTHPPSALVPSVVFRPAQ